MERLDDRGAVARARAVIDDDVAAAGAERGVDGAVHRVPIRALPDGVVVDEHVHDEVEVVYVGAERILERAVVTHDACVHGLRETRRPRCLCETLEHERAVLAMHHARLADDAHQELRRVAAARRDFADAHAGRDAEHRQELGRSAAGIELAIRGVTIGCVDGAAHVGGYRVCGCRRGRRRGWRARAADEEREREVSMGGTHTETMRACV